MNVLLYWVIKQKLPTWNWDVEGVTDPCNFESVEKTPVQTLIINGNPFESQEWSQATFNLFLSYFNVFRIIKQFTIVEHFTPGDIDIYWFSAGFDGTRDCQTLLRSNFPCCASLDHQPNFTWGGQSYNYKEQIPLKTLLLSFVLKNSKSIKHLDWYWSQKLLISSGTPYNRNSSRNIAVSSDQYTCITINPYM